MLHISTQTQVLASHLNFQECSELWDHFHYSESIISGKTNIHYFTTFEPFYLKLVIFGDKISSS